jgi:hypothetical protein
LKAEGGEGGEDLIGEYADRELVAVNGEWRRRGVWAARGRGFSTCASQPQQQPPYQVAARWRAEFFFQNSTQYISGTIISIVFVCLIRRLDRPFYKDKLNVTL